MEPLELLDEDELDEELEEELELLDDEELLELDEDELDEEELDEEELEDELDEEDEDEDELLVVVPAYEHQVEVLLAYGLDGKLLA